jgi:large subunit ribosomal protein L5
MATAKGPKKPGEKPGKKSGDKPEAKPAAKAVGGKAGTRRPAKAAAKAAPGAEAAEAKAPARPKGKGAVAAVAPPRLRARYTDEVRGRLLTELGLRNVMEVPRLEKIVVNVGLGEAVANGKLLETAAEEIATITGQKPIVTRARKAIATFRLRKGMAIGCKVTLRGRRMYEFMDRLISLGLPRIRDFRGVSPRSFDGRGNYALGVKEQLIFPEIDYEQTAGIHGMDIIFVTTARTDDQGRALLAALGMPFRAK